MIPMSDDEQEAGWDALYEKLAATLAPFGKDSAVGRGDYWILDDNYGWPQHKVYFWNLDMLRPEVVAAVQSALAEFPKWDVVVALDMDRPDRSWPETGLIIRKHEIIDGLQRQYFPPEYQTIEYEGSRRGTDLD